MWKPIDRVPYDDSTLIFPFADGVSAQLDPDSYNATDNDTPANWCAGTDVYSTGNSGTPGDVNDECPP